MTILPGALVRLTADVGLDPSLYAKVGDWIEERQRWALQLSNGAPCAARPNQLMLLSLQPGALVQVAVRDGVEVSAEVLQWVADRGRWAVRLQTGQDAAAHPSQLTLLQPLATDPPPNWTSHASQAPQGCCQNRGDSRAGEGDGGDSKTGCGGKDGEIWEGVLDDEGKMLVELVANSGLGDWEAKRLAILATIGIELTTSTAAELEKKWETIAPTVKSIIRDKPVMPCGHSCASCPTKADCHLEGILDMEDLGVGKKMNALNLQVA
mmetsp:Transcript_27802/g.38426  ORF Transcript_27802/g.38426 Transcript_27802/m.38426 type:complete len:266 (-) Transcript_27802:126-923(-)